MLHLDADRLAALADNEPSATEAEHLAACLACAREVDLYRGLRGASADVREAALVAPLTSWETLAPALRDAGLLRETGQALRFVRWRPVIGAAAAAVLLASGIVMGRLSAPVARDGGGQLSPVSGLSPSGVTLAGNGGMLKADGTRVQSLTDALKLMQRAEHDYRVAVAFIASHDTSSARGDADRYRTRLAALDRVRDAALEGVNESPDDPVLNQYLLSARSAHDVTLQQLKNTLPAGVSFASY